MQGQNTIDEVLCLSAQQGYTVFYRNCEGNNVLSDIVVAHLTSIEIIRTWSYKMYNTPRLEVVGMTPTGKNFTVATTFMRNEQTMTYRWVLQQIKHLYFSSAMSIENQQDVNEHEPKAKWKSMPDFLHYLFNTWLNPLAHKFVRCWTKSVMHFGVEITNRAESEHSVLKLWLSTCHGDLDTVFLNN
ncbi:hypothetical protein M9H77_02805 [Catharanthus roseus]|uniref:Uncharacterized protein n=1 Tax=Catharanthus roseus TaxID=4058 RepID=A0ACC0C9F7_CATRO|nr:hypothetical protein M9H77_02805 [Catharanthus roseus]